MKKSLLFILLSFFLLTVPAGLNAQNIKVLRKGGIDATELKSLVADITRDCKTDQEKMIALWAFITRKPFYHWCESREGPRATTEYGIVYDPVKAFNVYGTVICYQVADLLANMATEAGIPARTRGFPYRHKVMEAWHDGAWHLYDAQYDCQAYYLKPDGRTVASLNEVHADPVGYILEQKNPTEPFFQFEKFNGLIWPWETREYVVENWYKAFTYEELGCYYPFDCQGHTMIISLRRGEKLVRRWDNESKWYCTSELYDFWMRDLTQRWVALGPHDPRNPLNTYTNGRLIYKPDWKAAEVNFLDGLYDGSNYRLDNGRVYPAAAGKASVCFQVSSPYLLVGHPNRLSLDGDSEGGAIFNATIFRADQGAKVSLSVSTDNGISWKNVWHDIETGEHQVKVDLTPYVEGNYSYLVRVGMKCERPDQVFLSGLELENSLFLSPVLLPAIEEGENDFTLELSEPSEQLCIAPDWSSIEALERSGLRIENMEYNERFNDRLTPPEGEEGTVVLEVDPPGEGLIHWMTIYGGFAVDPQTRGDDLLSISWAQGGTTPPDNWQVLWESTTAGLAKGWSTLYEDPGRTVLAEHWRVDKSVEARPDKPCTKCYVKFSVKRDKRAALNELKVYVYYEPERPAGHPGPGELVVTHEWQEDGVVLRHKETPASEFHTYTVTAKKGPVVNESVTIEVKNAIQ